MILRRSFISFFIFSVLLPVICTAQGELNIKGNIESGQIKSIGEFLSNESSFVTALQGLIGYGYEGDNLKANCEIKVRPEYFSATKKLSSLKFKGYGQVLYSGEDLDLGLTLTRQLNRVSDNFLSIDYDLFTLQSNIVLALGDNRSLSACVGYSYQNVSSKLDQKHDFIFLDSSLKWYFENNLNICTGFYIEQLNAEAENIYGFQISTINRKATRIGPQIEINYLHNFILNSQYRILFQSLDSNSSSTIEHWIRLLAGYYLTDNLAFFLLADYYKRNINDAADYLVSSFNTENYISFKTSYDLNENCEAYLKAGYFKHNLLFNNINFEGWNYMIGFEINY